MLRLLDLLEERVRGDFLVVRETWHVLSLRFQRNPIKRLLGASGYTLPKQQLHAASEKAHACSQTGDDAGALRAWREYADAD